MVKLPTLRKSAAIFLGLCVALAGCQKTETSPEAPQAAAPAAAAAAPAPKSATPNSFDDVTAQLDPGGDLYLYLSTEQFLSKLSKGVDSLHQLVLSGSISDMGAPDQQQVDQVFGLLKDVVDKSGIAEISGLGVSSFAVAPGLHRTKVFIHHYPNKDTGIIWSLYGKDPHALPGLDFLPADTALANVGDFDLALLINFLRQEVQQSNIPEAKQALSQWETQFAAVAGMPVDDFLQSLNGAGGLVLTLDSTSTISVPLSTDGAPQTIPTPRLAIMLAVKNDLIFKQVDRMLGGNPNVIKVDEPDLKMRTMPAPIVPGLDLRPSVAQWNGYVVFASDDKLIRDMIAVQKGAPGYKAGPEYAALSAGLPDQGNNICVMSQSFAETVHKFQGQMMANQPNSTPAQAAIMQQWISNFQKIVASYGVGVQLPNGRLGVAQTKVMAP